MLRGYSTLGQSMYDDYYANHGSLTSALVSVESIPYTRVFLGLGAGRNEDEVFEAVSKLGNEVSFEWIERLYFKMKEERENG